MNFKKLFHFPNIFITLTVFICLFFGFITYSGIFHYNQSPSMPYGFYMKDLFHSPLSEGDYVCFRSPTPEVADEELIKRIDKIQNGKLYVKGDSSEVIFDRCKIEGLISYDSDYFGWIDSSTVTKVHPFITWNFL